METLNLITAIRKIHSFKIKQLLLITGIFFLNNIYAGDVKVSSEKDNLTLSNEQISIEINIMDTIKFSNISDKNNPVSLNISLSGKGEKNKLQVKKWNIEKSAPDESIVTLYAENPDRMIGTFSVRKDSDYISLIPSRVADEARIEMQSQVSVLPDMMAEDYIYFPDKLKNECIVPTDAHCLLNLMNNGNAMAACMWPSDDSMVYLGQNSAQSNYVDYNKIEFGRHRQLYLGIISAPAIWHIIKEKLDNNAFKNVDWHPPFSAAQWLMTMKLKTGLLPLNDNNFDTWVIPERAQDKTPVLNFGVDMLKKDIWNAWGSGHGSFIYPCYFEKNSLFARLPVDEKKKISYNQDYPIVIYTYRNTASSKAVPVLPYDKLAEILPYNGIQHIRTLMSPENIYPATCGITPEILRYFKDDKAEEKKYVILKKIDSMLKFVDVKDKRFNEYRNWAIEKKNELKRIGDNNKALKPIADETIGYLQLIEKTYAEISPSNTPDAAAALTEKYIKLIEDKDLSSEEKEEKADKLGREIRVTGGAKDGKISMMRRIVKSIRFHMTERLAGPLSTDEAAFVMKIRKDCGDILWMKHWHEGK